jgi:hypothetical protein
VAKKQRLQTLPNDVLEKFFEERSSYAGEMSANDKDMYAQSGNIEDIYSYFSKDDCIYGKEYWNNVKAGLFSLVSNEEIVQW